MSEKRANLMLNYIKQKKEVTLKELCQLFPLYNEMTIRRDLIMLEKNGYIKRFRGGARLCEDSMMEFYNYQKRRVSALENKQYIAIRAAELLDSSESVYFDAGTTMLELAKIMPDIPLFITTNDPAILFEGLQKKHVEIFLTGGSLNKSVVSLSGPIALDTLDKINIDTAFVGAAGFSTEHGFTNALYNECELKKKAIAVSKKTVMLLDSSKFNKSLPYTFATLKNIHTIITDAPLPDNLAQAASKENVQVIFK
jgi:DeoR/GlpR family transcriptional regulator of sugar metabolism